jgi:hypothetical protein
VLFAIAVVAALASPALAAPSAAPPSHPSPAEASAMLARLPLTFFAHQGEGSGDTRFETRGARGRMLLGDDGVVLVLAGGGTPETPDAGSPPSRPQPSVVRIRFEGGHASSLVGADPRPGRVNLIHGDDPGRWRRNLPTFGAVEYRQLFPGIDLRYEGVAGDVESTYRVAAGVDPARIRWLVEGVSGAQVEAGTGDLLLAVGSSGAVLRERAPVAWQEVEGRRQPVAVRFHLQQPEPPVRVAFALGEYDHSLPLVIDPTLIWTTYMGGTQEDNVTGVAMDAQGFVYLAGTTGTDGFPVAGGYDGEDEGIQAFVAKLNPLVTPANQLIYSSLVSGSDLLDFVEVRDLAIDASGRTYVVGEVRTVPIGAFPTPDGYQGCATVFADGFPLFFQLSAAGDDLLYATCLRGDGTARSIALDASNRAYIGGDTAADDFPTFSIAGSGPFQEDQPGVDGFVAKIDPALDGNASLLFSTYLGGSGTDRVYGIAVDPSNRTYVTGVTGSADFPTTAGAFDTTITGGNAAFVSKVDGVGSSLFYSTFLGGSSIEEGRGIAVDAAGNAYVTGVTSSADFPLRPTTGFLQGNQPNSDAFVTKLSPNGSALLYSTYLGGDGSDEGHDITVKSGVAYVVGKTFSAFFPTKDPVQSCGPGGDAFVSVLGLSGQQLVLSSCLRGSASDSAEGVAVGPLGMVLVGGETLSTNLPIRSSYDSSCSSCPDLSDGFAALIAEVPLQRDGFELGTTAEWVTSP